MSTKTYDRQTGKFLARVAENMPEMSGEVMQGWIDNPKALQNFLGGLVPLAINIPVSTIHVDRSASPAYPDWVKEALHPELEKTGPAEYDAAKLELWLHESQKKGRWVKGEKIYEHLKKEKMLESCLGLSDLLAIQVGGIAFFRQHFAGKAVFGWKSVVRHRDGNLSVPYLYENGDEVVLRWDWLGNVWHDSYPALRFAS